jgi:hypothetical protein
MQSAGPEQGQPGDPGAARQIGSAVVVVVVVGSPVVVVVVVVGSAVVVDVVVVGAGVVVVVVPATHAPRLTFTWSPCAWWVGTAFGATHRNVTGFAGSPV